MLRRWALEHHVDVERVGVVRCDLGREDGGDHEDEDEKAADAEQAEAPEAGAEPRGREGRGAHPALFERIWRGSSRAPARSTSMFTVRTTTVMTSVEARRTG